MKKIIALILALVMLGSVSAFAADFEESIEVRETDDRYTVGDETELNTPKTELWLQVEANGQIDVTVPLVLVFQTNIDGGSATSPDTYKITNNSTADLVVTKIETSVENKTGNPNVMEHVAYSTTAPTEDQYMVQLRVDEPTVDETTWDLKTSTHTASAISGGLFELTKAAKNGNGTPTRVYADMTTGELSFVTLRKTDDTAADDTKGVYLLTVTYTVAIDTSDAIGIAITDNGNTTVNGSDT